MPSINNWPSFTKEELRDLLKDDAWRQLYEQQWTSALMDPDDIPFNPTPREAVRIHLEKDRWPRRGRYAFREHPITIEKVPQEPEQPYKNDPRYGTWG